MPQQSRFSSRGLSIVAAFGVALVPFGAYATLMLAHFYRRGAVLLDSGLLAWLAWCGDPAQTFPAALGHASFYAFHLTPLFLASGAVARAVGAAMVPYFAVLIGLSQALLALGAFWLLLPRPRAGVRQMGMAAALALGFAFSGLAVAVVLYPHFDQLTPACFLLFAAALRAGRRWLAAMFFVVGLSVREDAGLHYFAVFAMAAALHGWRREADPCLPGTRWFAAAALLYPLTALIAQHAAFPGVTHFQAAYLGRPPYAHLSLALVGRRLLYLLVARPYIVLPLLGVVAWARLARNGMIAAAALASLPWLVLNLLSTSPLASALISYDAFPFLIALAWPLVAARPADRPRLGFAVVLALSFVPSLDLHNPGRLQVPRDFFSLPGVAERARTEAAVATLARLARGPGRMLVNQSIAALAPDAFRPDQMVSAIGTTAVPPDAVAYFAQGYDADRLSTLAEQRHFAAATRIPGTPILLRTRESADPRFAIAP